MADISISKFMPARKRRNDRAKQTERDRNVEIFRSLLDIHIHKIAKRHGIRPRNIVEVVAKATGKVLPYLEAMEWLIDDYAASCPRGQWEWLDKAVDEMKRGIRRVRREEAQAREQRLAKEAALAAQAIPGAEFYQSLAWRQLRYTVIKERGSNCEACKRSGKEHGVAIHVDHILPRSEFPDLALEPTNLQILCADCNIGKGTHDTTDWRVDPTP